MTFFRGRLDAVTSHGVAFENMVFFHALQHGLGPVVVLRKASLAAPPPADFPGIDKLLAPGLEVFENFMLIRIHARSLHSICRRVEPLREVPALPSCPLQSTLCPRFMSEYNVQFEVFEGPLDLLLYLIKKEEVDIYEVNLTKLATQFIEYIDLMRQFDLEVAGEFLVMASTLMYIKSRELLPVEQQVVVEAEDEGEDPRWELIRQLVEYKKFKDAAAQLQVREAEQENIFPRLPGKLAFESTVPLPKPDVSIFDLLNAVNGVLLRFKKREGDARDIFEDKWTVSEKIESILKILAERDGVRFAELFES